MGTVYSKQGMGYWYMNVYINIIAKDFFLSVYYFELPYT